MKATHTVRTTGKPVGHIKVEFRVTSEHIEAAIGTLMEYSDDKITKATIAKEIKNNFQNTGFEVPEVDWDGDFSKAIYNDAVSIARRYFPDFYID